MTKDLHPEGGHGVACGFLFFALTGRHTTPGISHGGDRQVTVTVNSGAWLEWFDLIQASADNAPFEAARISDQAFVLPVAISGKIEFRRSFSCGCADYVIVGQESRNRSTIVVQPVAGVHTLRKLPRLYRS